MGFFLTQLVFIFQNGKVKMLSLVEPATFACMTAVSSPPDRKKKKNTCADSALSNEIYT